MCWNPMCTHTHTLLNSVTLGIQDCLTNTASVLQKVPECRGLFLYSGVESRVCANLSLIVNLDMQMS